MTAVEIGRKIKQLRIQKGLTLEELASRSELTKGFLSPADCQGRGFRQGAGTYGSES